MADHEAVLETLAPGLVDRLHAVAGIAAVTLGGSRARGDQRPDSDCDLGLCYSGPLDVARLQALADEYSTASVLVTAPGGWGPWVDGGAWLIVDGIAIDLIYRELDRVRQVWSDCQAGRFTNETQSGHPLGFWSHAYAGEVGLAVILKDTQGQLSDLKLELTNYPQPLADALVRALWEASFSVANARKAISRCDVAYVAGCLFRAVGVIAHSVHGHDHRWLLNEKGAVAGTASLPSAPLDFEAKVNAALERLGPTESGLTMACVQLEALIAETRQRLV